MATREVGMTLADVLKNNSVLKELNVSSNTYCNGTWDDVDGPGFAQTLAEGIIENLTLTSLISATTTFAASLGQNNKSSDIELSGSIPEEGQQAERGVDVHQPLL